MTILRSLKLLIRIGLFATLAALLSILAACMLIEQTAQGRTFTSAETIPQRQVGLVLGCANNSPE